jgi:aspartokinase/homoserine dehydrogenase 1
MSDTNVVLLGVGAIGRELLRQLATNHRTSVSTIRVCGLVDRSGFVFEPAGLSWRRAMELRAHKASGRSLATAEGGRQSSPEEAVDTITSKSAGMSRANRILVDATAADTLPLLETALVRGCDLVLANKLPLAGTQSVHDRLHDIARVRRRRILHEATVGAGLPVIDTLHKLVDAGDRVLAIDGCPSGTLGFLFGELGKGRSFSSALHDAVAAGFTEPDPRTDLSGIDVARKALILARLLGFRGDLEDVAVESLVPKELGAVTTDAFLSRASELDAAWDANVRAARTQGCVLRYRARVTRRSISIGLAHVAAGDPLSTLSGTDNQFAFTTSRYRTQPLVITGPGAGPAVTAAGVYNDLLLLASTQASRRSVRAKSA